MTGSLRRSICYVVLTLRQRARIEAVRATLPDETQRNRFTNRMGSALQRNRQPGNHTTDAAIEQSIANAYADARWPL